MKTIIHPSSERGHADHGWLNTYHSFSFASFYDPQKTNFGALRVLNDDTVHAGKGFGRHPHDNMEILTIPLEGAVEHTDSMGNKELIHTGEIQVMSAGTGIYHSEMNGSKTNPLKLLQIWVIPDTQNIKPRYDEARLEDLLEPESFSTIVSPKSEGKGLWMQQNAWFQLGKFQQSSQQIVEIHGSGQGLYVFVIEGKIRAGGLELGKRDAIGIWEAGQVKIDILEPAYVLLIEVPMKP